MKLRLRWQGDRPRIGEYLMTPRGRGGYLIHGVRDRGQRGGLGRPFYRLLEIEAQRVSRQEAAAGTLHLFFWDRRKRKRPLLPRPIAGGGAGAIG